MWRSIEVEIGHAAWLKGEKYIELQQKVHAERRLTSPEAVATASLQHANEWRPCVHFYRCTGCGRYHFSLIYPPIFVQALGLLEGQAELSRAGVCSGGR